MNTTHEGLLVSSGHGWHARATELALWAMARIVNRNDRCGGCYVDNKDKKIKRTTRPSNGAEAGFVNLKLLGKHFQATATDDVIGLHPLGPDSLGKWCAIDVDAHGVDTDNPKENLRLVCDLYAVLVQLGFKPLLYESNGKGGYHLYVLFNEPISGSLLSAFGRWLVRDFAQYGMATSPEVFPKQTRLDEKTSLGNWLRLVGRHYKREFWAKVWDGANWLEGAAAVAHVLSLDGDDPSLIPEQAIEFDPSPKPVPRLTGPKNRVATPGVSIFQQFDEAQTAESMERLLNRAGWEVVKKGDDLWTFKRMGSENDQNGSIKLFNHVWVFYGFSPNTKLPAGQGLNPSQLRAEIDFGGHDTSRMAALALALETEGYVGAPPAIIGIKRRQIGEAATNGARPKLQPTANRTTTCTTSDGPSRQQSSEIEPTGQTAPEPAAPLPDPDDGRPPVALSDVGNGYAFRADHLSAVRFVDDWNTWLIWDGCRWQHDRSRRAEELAKQTAARLFTEAAEAIKILGPATTDKTDDQKARIRHAEAQLAHARKSHAAKAIGCMLAMAKSERGIRQFPEVFDRDIWAFNTPTGSIDLKTGTVRPHRREDNLTKLCPTPYDLTAECPTWDRFLESVFEGDKDLIRFTQRYFGYALTGDTREHLLAVFWGDGSNGKSTFLEVIMAMMGPDYAMKAPHNLLMARDRDPHPTERADLHGKRLVCAIETDDGKRLAESLIKELTGGDTIRARRMRENFFQFDPTHKLILCTNHKPQVRGSDNGTWRRLRLVPFAAQFWNPDVPPTPGEARHDHLRAVKGMKDQLLAEAPGILAWAVRGCLDWQANGLGCPEKVVTATSAFRQEENLISRFIADQCQTHTCYRIKCSVLYGSFKTWCQFTGVADPPSQRSFGLMMTEAKYTRSSNGSDYIGISLVKSDDSS